MKYNITKRLTAIAAAFASVLAVCSSCEDTYEPVAVQKAITITSSDVLFGPVGGVGTIGFESEESVTAYSEQPWCTVSVDGNVVSVAAAEYGELENRYASIILKSSLDSVRVVAQQNGVVMTSDVEDEYLLSDVKSEIKFNVKSNAGVKLTSSASWLRCAIVDESVTVTVMENETGHMRNGWFAYSSGTAADTVYVAQAEPKDLYGNYRLSGYNSSNALVYLPASISAGEGENDLVVTFTPSGVSWKIYGTFDPLTHDISFSNGQYAGEWNVQGNIFYVYCCMLSKKTSSFTWLTDHVSLASPEYDAKLEQTRINILPVAVENSVGIIDYDSWIFTAFTNRNESTGAPQGSVSGYPAILYQPFFQSI